MRTSPSRLLTLAGLALVAGVFWLGVEWWIARQPLGEDFSAEVARLTGDVPETPASLAVPDGPVRLAVGPLGLTDAAAEGAVADLLVAELSGDEGFQLVERRDFARLMREFELGAAGAIKPADAVRLGRLLGADWFVLGGAYRAGTEASAVVRVLDAASGIVRDLLVLPGGQEPTRAAASLAALLRRQRTGTEAGGELPEFVAVGGFEDLSVRSRHAGVEAELRSHLTATLAGGLMIVLERELTRLLLEEIRLQQAGLIESTNPLPRLQSTFWLVDGFWQELDSVGDDVELSLRVSRIGGVVQRRNLRAKLGPALKSAAATAMVDLIRNAPPPDFPATRKGEIRAQLARGMERAGFTDESLDSWSWSMWWVNRWRRSEQEMMARREHLQAAMQNFEAVLLLDPNHGMAKLFLARCLVDPAVARPGEARGLYRELLEDQSGLVTRTAMFSLGASFEAYGDFDQAIATFRDLESSAPETFKSGLRQRIEFASRHTRDQDQRAVDWSAREAAAMKSLAAWREQAIKFGHYGDSGVISDFLSGPKAQAAERLARLEGFLPQLLAAAPELEPHLLTLILRQWPATNHPFVARFEASLRGVRQDPARLLAPGNYFSRLSWDGFDWAFDHKLNDLAAQMADTVLAARNAGVEFDFKPGFQMRVALAYSYANRPRDAVAACQLVEDEVVAMGGSGPWGGHPSWLLRDNLLRYNQRKLGEQPSPDPLGFEPGAAVNVPPVPVLFVPDDKQLWLVNANRVWSVPLAGGLSVTNEFSPVPWLAPQALQQTAETLWIGSDLGLFSFNKQTRAVRHWSRADGLLLDEIRSLWLANGRLWIGYELNLSAERRWVGGVSVMSLQDGQIRSFIPPLGEAKDTRTDFDLLGTEPAWNKAPRRPVRAFVGMGPDEIVTAVSGVGLQRFNLPANEWSATSPKVADPLVEVLVASDNWLVSGEAPSHADRDQGPPLAVISRKSGELYRFGKTQGLPFSLVTALCLDGDRLWVGGPCYLLILDLSTRSIVRRCMMNNTTVHHLQFHGDDVWVRLNRAIYRFPRSLAHEVGPP